MNKGLKGFVALLAFVQSGVALAQSASGFPNEVLGEPGDFLAHPAPEMGRLAIIDIIGNYVVSVPEAPSSPKGSDFIVRAWDFSSLDAATPPIEHSQYGTTKHPFLAHGLIKHGNQLYIGGWPENAVAIGEDGEPAHVRWTGPAFHFSKSGMSAPWSATDYWSYGVASGNSVIRMYNDETNDHEEIAEWDHLALTGVIGFANFMGDLLIYASDQSKTGVASYDVSEVDDEAVTAPKLLDVINSASLHPTITYPVWTEEGRVLQAVEGGIGGYWNEIYGHYIVFSRKGSNPGVQVIDFSDPTNLEIACEFFSRDSSYVPEHQDDYGSMNYVGFQDNYIFAERFKINLDTCLHELALDQVGAGSETSQYARPIGNFLLTGGLFNWRTGRDVNDAGMGVWVHQAEADLAPPYVTYHIPQADRTDYPLFAPISVHIPETIRSETITYNTPEDIDNATDDAAQAEVNSKTLRMRKIGVTAGEDDIALNYVLSHMGMLTINPEGELEPDTTYEVILVDIEDAVHNKMEEYRFRFSTGATVDRSQYSQSAPIPMLFPRGLSENDILAGLSLTAGGENVPFDFEYKPSAMSVVVPEDDLDPNTTYEFSFVGSAESGVQIKDPKGKLKTTYSFTFSTGEELDAGATPQPTMTPTPGPTSTPTPTPVPNLAPEIISLDLSEQTIVTEQAFSLSVNADARDGDSLLYRYNLGLGGGYGPWGSAAILNTSYSEPGSYRISVQVRDRAEGDDDGEQVTGTIVVTVLRQQVEIDNTINNRFNSSSVMCDVENGFFWVANPDNHTIAGIDVSGLPRSGGDNAADIEFPVDKHPQSVATDSAGNVWVTSRKEDTVNIYTSSGDLVTSINMGYGSSPYGIVMSDASIGSTGAKAYVTLYGSGELARIDVDSRAEDATRIELEPTASALAISLDGSQILVNRFISPLNWGEVWSIDADNWTLDQVITLRKDDGVDGADSGRGVPNYLASVAIHPNGTRAYITANKANVDRSPILFQGIDANVDLDDDNTIRPVLMTLDLTRNIEMYGARVDLDNGDSPSSLAFSPNAEYLFVGIQGLNEIQALNLVASGDDLPTSIDAQFPSGFAPQGLCMDGVSNHLVSKNMTDRTISAIDVDTFLNGGNVNPPISVISTVANEVMTEQVRLGKQIFYNAADERMSAEGYMSCATCHIEGGQDGRTYDFSGRGEGLRNNISLLGRMGARFGRLHWSANFDEVQDFEHDIRGAFLGDGFLTDFAVGESPLDSKAGRDSDLDALAAYVSSLGKDSLPRSPHKTSAGEHSEAGLRGQALFNSADLNCSTCHVPPFYTNGLTHNVGTFREYSGKRLGQDNLSESGLKTPSLLGAFATAPYLHDGSAETLEDVFKVFGGTVYQAEDASGGTVVESEYLRKSFGSVIVGNSGGNGSELVFSNIDGGQGGGAAVRFRYAGSVLEDGVLRMVVNGDASYEVPLEYLPVFANTGVRGNYAETSSVQINLNQGASNTIVFTYEGAGSDVDIVIDDLTVTNIDDFTQSSEDNSVVANAHLRALGLGPDGFADLVQFIKELDSNDAPEDSATLPISVPFPDDLPAPVPAPNVTSAPTPSPTPLSTGQPVATPTPAVDDNVTPEPTMTPIVVVTPTPSPEPTLVPIVIPPMVEETPVPQESEPPISDEPPTGNEPSVSETDAPVVAQSSGGTGLLAGESGGGGSTGWWMLALLAGLPLVRFVKRRSGDC